MRQSPALLRVVEAMTVDVWTVDPDTPLARVAAEMGLQKYGAAVVLDDQQKPIGIFTITDVARALADLA